MGYTRIFKTHSNIKIAALTCLLTVLCSLCYGNIDSTKLESEASKSNIQPIDKHILLAKENVQKLPSETLIHTQEALLIAIELNDSAKIAECMLLSGTAYMNLGLLNVSYEKLTQAKLYFKQHCDTPNLITVYKNLGNLYWFKKDFNRALNTYKFAHRLSIAIKNNSNLSAIYTNIGISYMKLNMTDSVLKYLKQAEKIAIKLKQNDQLSGTYLNMGAYYEKINNLDSSKLYYHKCLDYKDAISKAKQSFVWAALAYISISEKNINEAKILLNKSRQLVNTNLIALQQYYRVKIMLDTLIGNYKGASALQYKLAKVVDSMHTKEFINRSANYNTLYKLNLREKHLIELENDNKLYSVKAKKNRYIMLLLLIISIITTVSYYLTRKSNKEKGKAISLLNIKNEELITHKEELLTLNKEIVLQREEVFQKNKELHRSINKIQKAQNQILSAGKIASAGVLAPSIVVEMNKSLSRIDSVIETFSKAIKTNNTELNPNELNKNLAAIKTAYTKTQSITNTLNALTQPNTNTVSSTNLNELINNTLNLVKHQLTNNILLTKNFGNIPAFKCYPEKLQSIIIHLISFAINSFIDSNKNVNKEITISTWVSKEQNNTVVLYFDKTSEKLGPVSIKNIFDPFYTSIKEDTNHSLNLYLVDNLVHSIDGKIAAENTKNGLAIKIEIPLLN